MITACDTQGSEGADQSLGPVTASEGQVTTNETRSADLSCDTVSAISVAPEPDGEGFETPEEAVESYRDWVADLPDGEWELFESELWILVDEGGETVGRARVGIITENAVTTFSDDRYWSGDIEYCP